MPFDGGALGLESRVEKLVHAHLREQHPSIEKVQSRVVAVQRRTASRRGRERVGKGYLPEVGRERVFDDLIKDADELFSACYAAEKGEITLDPRLRGTRVATGQ